jgi:AraC family transcriptional regulator
MKFKIHHSGPQTFLPITRHFGLDVIHEDDNNDIPHFWDECQDALDQLLSYRPAGKKDLYGLCSIPTEDDTTFEYGIGIRLDDETLGIFIPDITSLGCTIWKLDESDYAVCECVGPDKECIDNAWAKFYTQFLPTSGYNVTKAPDIEIYKENANDVFCELWIPIKKA